MSRWITFITKGVNALAINPVDRTAAGPIIEKAKAKDLSNSYFLNREARRSKICRVMTRFGM